MSEYMQNVLAQVKAKNPSEPEFHQAVQEVAESLESCPSETSGVSISENPRAYGRTGTRGNVPCPWMDDQERDPHQSGI